MKLFDETQIVKLAEKYFGNADISVPLGIGDDCAAVTPSRGCEIVTTTDSLVEEIHFDLACATPRQVGCKAVAVNLSDISAMGAAPKWILLSLVTSHKSDRRFIKALFGGIKSISTKHSVTVAGGNVAGPSTKIVISITAIGEIKKGYRIDRSGAKGGDYIFVTGTIGDSGLGLKLLQSGKTNYSRDEKRLINRHLLPTPRVEEGKLLADKKLASAMIDISDGLPLDLSRLLTASRLSANINLSKIPLSLSAKKSGQTIDMSAGEDYELLFTVPERKLAMLEKAIAGGKISATCIGQCQGAADKKAGQVELSGSAQNILFEVGKGYLHR